MGKRPVITLKRKLLDSGPHLYSKTFSKHSKAIFVNLKREKKKINNYNFINTKIVPHISNSGPHEKVHNKVGRTTKKVMILQTFSQQKTMQIRIYLRNITEGLTYADCLWFALSNE